jgi:hypothetical protein
VYSRGAGSKKARAAAVKEKRRGAARRGAWKCEQPPAVSGRVSDFGGALGWRRFRPPPARPWGGAAAAMAQTRSVAAANSPLSARGVRADAPHASPDAPAAAPPAAAGMRPRRRFIGPRGEDSLRRYKYTAVDRSIIAPWLQPFWTRFVQLVPLWVAPNCITVGGLALIILSCALSWLTSPQLDVTTSTGIMLTHAALLFMYQTLDAVDGKQARESATPSKARVFFAAAEACRGGARHGRTCARGTRARASGLLPRRACARACRPDARAAAAATQARRTGSSGPLGALTTTRRDTLVRSATGAPARRQRVARCGGLAHPRSTAPRAASRRAPPPRAPSPATPLPVLGFGCHLTDALCAS